MNTPLYNKGQAAAGSLDPPPRCCPLNCLYSFVFVRVRVKMCTRVESWQQLTCQTYRRLSLTRMAVMKVKVMQVTKKGARRECGARNQPVTVNDVDSSPDILIKKKEQE